MVFYFFVNLNNYYRIICYSCDSVFMRGIVVLVYVKYIVSIRCKVLIVIWFKSLIVIRRN